MDYHQYQRGNGSRCGGGRRERPKSARATIAANLPNSTNDAIMRDLVIVSAVLVGANNTNRKHDPLSETR